MRLAARDEKQEVAHHEEPQEAAAAAMQRPLPAGVSNNEAHDMARAIQNSLHSAEIEAERRSAVGAASDVVEEKAPEEEVPPPSYEEAVRGTVAGLPSSFFHLTLNDAPTVAAFKGVEQSVPGFIASFEARYGKPSNTIESLAQTWSALPPAEKSSFISDIHQQVAMISRYVAR